MSLRRFGGWLLSLSGAALMSVAGFQLAHGALLQDRARREWIAAEAAGAVAAAHSAVDAPAAPRSHRAGTPVARLLIPRIALDEIVVEGVSDAALNIGPGHFPGTAYPGDSGNAVISAHRDRHFRRLDELEIGDTIQTEMDQTKTKWVIVGRKVIDKDAPAIFQTTDTRLTLTTCWPVRYLGAAPDRLILVARPAA